MPADPIPDAQNDGGDPACWAHLICPECGILTDADDHQPWCRLAPERTPSSEESASDR